MSFATIFVLALVSPTLLPDAAWADDVEGPRCVEVRKSAPYRGFGHQHIVHLRNTCDEAVHCRVSTDVTPQAQTLSVAPGEEESVLTRSGSPASVFEAVVDCEQVRN